MKVYIKKPHLVLHEHWSINKYVIFDGNKRIHLGKKTTLITIFDDFCEVKPPETH